MTDPKLLEVGVRLEEAVQGLVDEGSASSDLYGTYEMVAIQILDSEFENYPEGELETYLKDFLDTKKQ
jgi:hypothetical protein